MQKWQNVDLASLDGIAGAWDEMLDQAGLLAGDEQLDMVNRWVNWHVRFADDRGSDQWASAAATLRGGSGDCEDFALAKMALLARLGRPRDDLVLVLVRDRLRSLDHAVLAVRSKGSFRILDNRSDSMRWAEDIDDYLPTLGYAGTFAWIYGRRYAGGGSIQPSAPQLP